MQQTVADEFSLHRFSSRERMIVEAIIGCLDSRDYLDASFDELRLILPAEHPFDDSEIEHVLGRIRRLNRQESARATFASTSSCNYNFWIQLLRDLQQQSKWLRTIFSI